MRPRVRIAAAQFPIQRLRNWNEYSNKLVRWVSKAHQEQAEILVFPEYAPMELISLVDRRTAADRRSPNRHTLGPLPVVQGDRRVAESVSWETNAIQPLIGRFCALHSELAEKHRVYILAGSLPVCGADGVVHNVAYFFSPDGTMGFQEKIIPTRWEREMWGIAGGKEAKVFETLHGPIGIAICYDVEFPLIARRQAEAKARIILVPCCTNSLRGYHRVRVGALARALENQAYLIQAPTIGNAPWSYSADVNVGSAGVYAPPDLGPRETGVVAQGRYNVSQWIFADLDLAAINRIRRDGVVANDDEWTSHMGIGPAVEGRFEPVTGRFVAHTANG